MSTAFQEKVYAITRRIPRGKVTTYAAIAHALGHTGYRSIGQALTRNQDAPRTPCHRVVNSDGTIGGYAFNVRKKIQLLESEGVRVTNGKIVDFEQVVVKVF